MKFTEGFWLRNERADAHYTAEVYETKRTEHGFTALMPFQKTLARNQTIDIGALTVSFRAAAHNAVTVTLTHHAGYDAKAPLFDVRETPEESVVSETDEEICLTTGALSVRVSKADGTYQFEADGQVITRCGFRNAAYIRWDPKPASYGPDERYLSEKDCTPYMLTELTIRPDEKIYGLGERFTEFVKNGQQVDMWNEDGGTASQRAYKNIPLYLSSKGYGVFVNDPGDVSFEVGSEKVGAVGFSVKGESMTYTLFYGPDLKDVLRTYTGMTGRPALPPAWSFGLWLSTSFTTSYDEKSVTAMIDEMERRAIPLSVLYLDCFWMKEFRLCGMEWDKAVFPDPEAMLARYHARGLKVGCWINPYVAQNTAMFEEGAEKGYFLMRRDGRGVWQTDHWQYGMAIVDFTNPEARRWWQEHLRAVLRAGIDSVKLDFGERIPVDVCYADGSDPVRMHNRYTLLYNQAAFEVIEEEKGRGQAVVFSRSATVGSQRFPLHWGGDCYATYSSMAETLRGGLSFTMSGFSFWSHDISGFESTATPDLYKRWVQFGLLSSHSRLHGSTSYRVPWLFGEEACDVVRAFVQLKCRLMPYLYGLSAEAHETGVPVMRAMVLEFGDDPAVLSLEMQYMLGSTLLVAPVFSEEGTARFYLPDGRWTEWFSGRTEEGGRWRSGTYDYFSLPLYVRENTLLPYGSRDDRPDYDYRKELEIRWYTPKAGEPARVRLVDMQGEPAGDLEAVWDGARLTVRSDRPMDGLRLTVLDNGRKLETVLTGRETQADYAG